MIKWAQRAMLRRMRGGKYLNENLIYCPRISSFSFFFEFGFGVGVGWCRDQDVLFSKLIFHVLHITFGLTILTGV